VLIQTSESKIFASESNDRKLNQIKIDYQKIRTTCAQVKSRHRQVISLQAQNCPIAERIPIEIWAGRLADAKVKSIFISAYLNSGCGSLTCPGFFDPR